MQGQIVQRGRSFAAVVYLGRDAATGKERRKWVSFRSRRDAERYLHQAVATLEAGGAIAASRQRLGEYLDDWLRGHAAHVAPTTLASYRDTVAVHLRPALGHVWLAKLQPQQIRDYMNAKLAAGLSTTTVRYHLMVLKTALNQAVRDGLVPRNVAALVKAPPKARRRMQALDVEQAQLFLGEARKSSPYYRLYAVALLTGMRQGELAALRWRDCDFVSGRAAIQQTMYRLGGSRREGVRSQVLFKPPKSGKARTVSLAPELVAELLALRKEQRERMRRLGPRYHDLDLVFAQADGKPLHMHNVARRDFREVMELRALRNDLRRKGVAEESLPKPLPRIRFHDLRHSAASLLLARGVHVKVVQELLGHQSALMTLDIYSHAIPALQEEAVHGLAGVLLAQAPEGAEALRTT